MSQTIVVRLTDETAERYRRGAAVAHRPLDEFISRRLEESVPPSADDLPPPLRDELRALEGFDDEALWEVTRQALLPARQQRYAQLVRKNARSALTSRERETLQAIGEEARRLTLLKAHAFLILKWRGHTLPSPAELARAE